jgi:hypothetical protein
MDSAGNRPAVDPMAAWYRRFVVRDGRRVVELCLKCHCSTNNPMRCSSGIRVAPQSQKALPSDDRKGRECSPKLYTGKWEASMKEPTTSSRSRDKSRRSVVIGEHGKTIHLSKRTGSPISHELRSWVMILGSRLTRIAIVSIIRADLGH